MNDITLITSTSNAHIKRLQGLQSKSSLRRENGLIVVEGVREVQHCVEAGFSIDTVYYCPTLCDAALVASHNAREVVAVAAQLYERIAYRGTTEGIIALARPRELALADLNLGDSPLIVVLEGVEKPGNLGAVLRSADAAAATAVVVCDSPTDVYNPNVVRGSLGAVFTVPVVACSTDECIAFLHEHDIAIVTAQLQDSLEYYDTDMTGPTAIVMGTESVGLTDAWRKAAKAHVRIPMMGRLDSLNVSVSAAVLLFEAVRQRRQGH